MRQATLIRDSKIQIRFYESDRAEFIELVEKIKTLPGREFNPTLKFWVAPASTFVVEQLIKWKFDIDNRIEDWYMANSSKQIKLAMPENLNLYKFQEEGVNRIEQLNGRALLADEMGLGKTIQTIAWLSVRKELRPVIIVVPAAIKLNWLRELSKWLPDEPVSTVYGQTPSSAIGPETRIAIINYDILQHHSESILKLHPQVLVIDECHYCKNEKAQRTKAIRSLSREIKHIIAISGTPIISRPSEFFTTLNVLRRDIWPSSWRFLNRYCNGFHNGFGWNFTGSKNSDELHDTLTRTVMIRRLKKDVLQHLPAKQRSIVPIEITNRAEYNSAQTDLIEWVKQNISDDSAARISRAEAITRVEYLKQIAVKGKLESISEWIDIMIDSGNKLVLYATHHSVIDYFMNRYRDKAVKVDGRDSLSDRQLAIDTFQSSDSCRLFIGNIKAAGVGITLTAASNVAFAELGWTPGEHDQAEDRVHRIGQTAESINAWYLLAKDTIEEEIAKVIDSKRKVLDKVLDGTLTEDESLLTVLMEKLCSM